MRVRIGPVAPTRRAASLVMSLSTTWTRWSSSAQPQKAPATYSEELRNAPASVGVSPENHGPLGRPALPDYNSRNAAGAGVAAGGAFPTRPKGAQRLSSPALASEAASPSVLSEGDSCPRVI